MHCTVPLLIINNHYRPFTLDSSLFMYSLHFAHILHRHFCKLGLYSFVFKHYITFVSLSTVIVAHLSSFVLIHFINLPLALSSHYRASKLNSAIFVHFTDLPVTLNSHYWAFQNHYSGIFIHCTDLAIILSSY